MVMDMNDNPFSEQDKPANLVDNDLSTRWNPSAPFRSDYNLQLSNDGDMQINFISIWASGDGTHTPTGMKVFSDSAMTQELAYSGLWRDEQNGMKRYTAALTSQFVGSSVYIKLLKATEYQIWVYQISLHSLSPATCEADYCSRLDNTGTCVACDAVTCTGEALSICCT